VMMMMKKKKQFFVSSSSPSSLVMKTGRDFLFFSSIAERSSNFSCLFLERALVWVLVGFDNLIAVEKPIFQDCSWEVWVCLVGCFLLCIGMSLRIWCL